MKSSAWSGGGAAAGAVVGSAGGPVGTIAGAAVGGASGHLMGENVSLRSGELQGEGAGDKEIARWRGIAATKATAYDGLKAWALRIAVAWGVFMAIKYLYPQSRSARNLWGGLRGLLAGERGSWRKIVSATGLAHTEAPKA